ncbi:MAG: MAE_28990/MAE_18760 family HEPN-like nuclease [Limisphaerales bacterium]
MTTVQQDFQTRAGEIENYFRFVEQLAEGNLRLTASAPSTASLSPDDYDSLLKTLKANGFILLYNLVESTMKNAIEAVFEEFRAKGVSFDDCREEVRQIVVSNLKAHNPDRVSTALTPLAQKILTETFRKEKAFAGNVDAKKIREVAKDYGFSPPKAKGDNLLTVKSQRNDLAHGDKAFAEVGRDFDVERLVKIKMEVLDYLREVLDNISSYLANKEYLAAPPIVGIPTIVAAVN